ncbi:MAG: translation initiation factor IF-2 [Candidatus Doudnabacteria bacterium RIFCSPHIGHO2_01_FULL_50_11]|uniref:Translation initiation factor IF-2 n=1 Tax=Candidatus Doudnabacteria bacterium RIFCSPHIGHO2_01_FULL_50_11 TaxID=1817828 RepID=A0A1F5PH25_9BACT|nr:MAG: translation initiation factor IF-2 [Candidatus Doudnabacteria bacterium RIFCSPHIGHO2_01_FULL_50_11]
MAVKEVTIPSVIAVRDLASVLGQSVSAVIKTLIQNGVMASMNEQIDFDAAAIVASEFGYEAKEEKGSVAGSGTVDEIIAHESAESLAIRPPIVAVMGHVDHGKTKLLDTIRSANVMATEAGAITQHIGAYKVFYKDKYITFLDTPGHEAFAAMRARGANVTDLIVLVVAADDGVKQQTLEVVNRAKLTRTPMIVALNKIDRAEANPDRVKSQLSEVGVVSEEWGGKTIFVPISAKQNIGVDKLLDMILLTAEVENYRANPTGTTVATVIESNLSKTQGPIASVIVQNGTLHVGDIVAVGSAYGKIRSMEDENGKVIRQASPSTPVRIAGLSGLPEVGDLLRVYTDIRDAQAESKKLLMRRQAKRLAYKTGISADAENQQLNLIIKADVQGSLEAILQELHKLENQDVKIRIVSQGVGEINESDVLAAESARGTIIGFHNSVSSAAARLAKQKKVNVDIYEIIYELTEDITQAILSLILPEVEEITVGEAKLLAVFRSERDYSIVGGTVLSGQLQEERKALLMREQKKIGEGKILELQRNKQVAKAVPAGSDFGLKISTKVKLQKGDMIRIVDEHLKEKKLKKIQ